MFAPFSNKTFTILCVLFFIAICSPVYNLSFTILRSLGLFFIISVTVKSLFEAIAVKNKSVSCYLSCETKDWVGFASITFFIIFIILDSICGGLTDSIGFARYYESPVPFGAVLITFNISSLKLPS